MHTSRCESQFGLIIGLFWALLRPPEEVKRCFRGTYGLKSQRSIIYIGFIGKVHPKKQPRRCCGFTAYFGKNCDNVVTVGRFLVLKVLNFFSQIYIISNMRLKFRSLSLLDYQNMSKPIPLFSNFIKIVFLKNCPS